MNRYQMNRLNPRSGQGLVEYSLIIGLVALALVATLGLLGNILSTNYIGNIGKMLTAVDQSGS